MEGTIVLEYSIDTGSTWKSATTSPYSAASSNIPCAVVRPWIQPEAQEEQPSSGTDEEVCYTSTARIYVHIRPMASLMDLTTSEGQKYYKFLCALRCAPLIRLTYSPDINGFTEWASGSNTNYLVPADTPPPTWPTTGEEDTLLDFTLKTKKEFAL